MPANIFGSGNQYNLKTPSPRHVESINQENMPVYKQKKHEHNISRDKYSNSRHTKHSNEEMQEKIVQFDLAKVDDKTCVKLLFSENR